MNNSTLEEIKKDGWRIKTLPPSDFTEEICKLAVQTAHPRISNTESILHYIPKRFRTTQLCLTAIQKK